MKPDDKDSNQLHAFFKTEYNGLKHYVKSRLSERADRDAEDIIQDVALKLFSRHGSSPIHNVAGFVYGALKNKIIDVMRTRRSVHTIDDSSEEIIVDALDWLYNVPDNSHSERMKHELKKALADLKPDYQSVILAIDFQGLTYREYAFETGTSEGTLMSRRHRALAILHKQLEKQKYNT
jgi:RNA polymerase sigma factor (sigma-70 family)